MNLDRQLSVCMPPSFCTLIVTFIFIFDLLTESFSLKIAITHDYIEIDSSYHRVMFGDDEKVVSKECF